VKEKQEHADAAKLMRCKNAYVFYPEYIPQQMRQDYARDGCGAENVEIPTL
jgi:hypothetical protein